MLHDILEYYGLTKEFKNAGFFETDNHKEIATELKTAVKFGNFIVLTGLVGSGKTVTIKNIRQQLIKEERFLVSKSFAVETEKVNLSTLIIALFHDLVTNKGFKPPSQHEKRERELKKQIRKLGKPVVLFIDEAHNLHTKTLIGLKRLMECIQDGDDTLSVVLMGHPKLQNDLRRAALEEIGGRALLIEMEGIKGVEKKYLNWMIRQCLKPKTKVQDVFTEESMELLLSRLITPLQFTSNAWHALELGAKAGVKPVTPDIVESVFALDLDDMETKLTRHGYNIKILSEMYNTRPKEIVKFLRNELEPAKTQEYKMMGLKMGLPL